MDAYRCLEAAFSCDMDAYRTWVEREASGMIRFGRRRRTTGDYAQVRTGDGEATGL